MCALHLLRNSWLRAAEIMAAPGMARLKMRNQNQYFLCAACVHNNGAHQSSAAMAYLVSLIWHRRRRMSLASSVIFKNEAPKSLTYGIQNNGDNILNLCAKMGDACRRYVNMSAQYLIFYCVAASWRNVIKTWLL